MRIGATKGLIVPGRGDRKGLIQGNRKAVEVLPGWFLGQERIGFQSEQPDSLQLLHFYITPEATAHHGTNFNSVRDWG